MSSKRVKTIHIQHDYYKISRWKKFLKYKNVLIFGVYLAAVILIVEFTEGNSIRKAYADTFKRSQSQTQMLSHKMTVKERLTLLYFKQYIKDADIAEVMMKNAIRLNLEPSLLTSIMKIESEFKPRAVNYNYNGSVDRGLFQLNSSVFTQFSEDDFFDIEKNTAAGAEHIKWCLKTSGNKLAKALALYNAGYGKVGNTRVGEVTLDYIQKIMDTKYSIEKDLNQYLSENSDILN